MLENTASQSLPNIVVSDSDYDQLVSIASAALRRIPEIAESLLTELERAKVVCAEGLPRGIARLGSTVTFSSDEGLPQRVTLVLPVDANIVDGKISILTPVGIALLGLSKGQSIMCRGRSQQRRLTVQAVE
ncbi:nucleoside diphosphate kinase regulator [Pelagibius sp. CAU 1746]|uniref:nucleoside diphosphate kinase regulator n=1 Tax=Pelagibius sp. CAU 1746 TaxID=3140370 RepID=UPI00325A8895